MGHGASKSKDDHPPAVSMTRREFDSAMENLKLQAEKHRQEERTEHLLKMQKLNSQAEVQIQTKLFEAQQENARVKSELELERTKSEFNQQLVAVKQQSQAVAQLLPC